MAILDSLSKNQEAVIGIVSAIGDEVSKARTAKLRISRQVTLMVFALLVVIIGASAFLVYDGKMADGSFTFLIGVVVGALMQYAGQVMFNADDE